MRKFYALFLFVLFGVSVGYATDYTATTTGVFYDSGTWDGNGIPPNNLAAGNTVTINSGVTVTMDDDFTLRGASATNNGTLVTSGTHWFYVYNNSSVFTNKGTIINNYRFYVYSGCTYVHDMNGGEVLETINFRSGSNLIIQGVTSTSPTFTAGDNFHNVTINCSSLTTEIDFLHGTVINNDLIITNTNTGSLTFNTGSNEYGVTGDLSIGASGKLLLEAGTKTTVTGTLSNAGTATSLCLESDGTYTASLIANQEVSATVERYLGANRWYMVGPATTGSTSSDFSGAYMQYYTETSDSWTYVTATTYSMVKGVGYGYYKTSTATPTFTGTLYNSSVGFSNMSLTGGASATTGWHVLSNPFSCAIQWNTGGWGLSGIDGTADYYNGSNWIPISVGAVLPANQGFAVRATSSTNSITIPTASRSHNGLAFRNLQDIYSYISLSLVDNIEKTNDLFFLNFNEDATNDYDNGYDAYEFVTGGSAGNLSSTLDGEYIAMLGVPLSDENEVYPLYLLKGEANEYSISIDELVSIENMSILLEDIQTGEFITLKENTIYTFDVNEGDDNHRFNLHLKNTTSVESLTSTLPFDIYSANQSIYIINSENKDYDVLVYDISGKMVYRAGNVTSHMNKIDLNIPLGAYFVKLVSGQESLTQKIIN